MRGRHLRYPRPAIDDGQRDPTAIYDVSGTGVGPFMPVMACGDASSGALKLCGSVTAAAADAQNAPLGLSGAMQGATLVPGDTAAAAPGRAVHVFCAPAAVAALGYATLTLANGETHRVQLAAGLQFDLAWAVTRVSAQTVVSGTLGACEFKNLN